MNFPYHPGEIAVQTQAGVYAEAAKLGSIISSTIKPAAKDFLQNQNLAIAATIHSSGIYTTLLTGKAGFLEVISDRILNISANASELHSQEIGLLVIDLSTRRRLRINGKIISKADRSIYIETQQVYFNCPKYIQLRRLVADDRQLPTASVQYYNHLNLQQQQWIAQSDTFLIASYAESGVDVSHRGGNPGFVQVLDKNQLVFPDYAGNNMFNTLGNILLNPDVALLFINFDCGATLQLTGKAYINWDIKNIKLPGAERWIEFKIEQVRQINNATSLRWQFIEYSPFNPVI